MDTIDLLPSDVSIGDLHHDDHHDLLHVGVKDIKIVLNTLSGETVRLVGDQTLAGNKTFSSPVVVPTATLDGHAVNKEQLDSGLLGKANSSHSHSIANISNLQLTLDGKAPLASPTFTGTPTAPTQSAADNSTKLATTAFVNSALSSGVVKLTGDQTIAGVKSFSSAPKLTNASTAGYSWVATGSDGSGSWQSVANVPGGTVPWANILGKPSTFPPEAHIHAIADTTGLSDALLAKVDATRNVIAGTGLSGGGDLTTNRTLSVTYGTIAGTAAQGNDSRLSNTRTPTDNTVSTTKYIDGSITIPKLATTARAYDFSFVQSLDTRSVGYGEMVYGVRIPRSIVITSIHYRMGTADASGASYAEIRTGATAASAPSLLTGTGGILAIDPTPVTGSFSVAAGTYLYIYTSAIGTTPGKGLIAEIQGYLA